jgi:sec-independent protein translocase protein TatA
MPPLPRALRRTLTGVGLPSDPGRRVPSAPDEARNEVCARMGSLSPVHWAIVIVVVLLLFGSRKLPDMARGLGQSMRILKAETRGLQEDDRAHTSTAAGEPGTTAAPNPPTVSGTATPTTPERPHGTAHPDAAAERPSSAERDAS